MCKDLRFYVTSDDYVTLSNKGDLILMCNEYDEPLRSCKFTMRQVTKFVKRFKNSEHYKNVLQLTTLACLLDLASSPKVINMIRCRECAAIDYFLTIVLLEIKLVDEDFRFSCEDCLSLINCKLVTLEPNHSNSGIACMLTDRYNVIPVYISDSVIDIKYQIIKGQWLSYSICLEYSIPDEFKILLVSLLMCSIGFNIKDFKNLYVESANLGKAGA